VLYSGTRPGSIIVVVEVVDVRWSLCRGNGWNYGTKRRNQLVAADICTNAASCGHSESLEAMSIV